MKQVLEVCYKTGVKVVTVYAFSIENFKRSKYEVDALMNMAKMKLAQLAQHGDLLDRYGASVRVLGRRELIRPDLLDVVDKAVNMTKENKQAILNICFPYTSQDEITTAIRNTVIEYTTPLDDTRKLDSGTFLTEDHTKNGTRKQHQDAVALKKVSENGKTGVPKDPNGMKFSDTYETDFHSDKVLFRSPETITEKTLDDHMFTADNPPLDLLIRTSGVNRLSDFMLWQCHEKTHIFFLDVMWPNFDLWTFLPVLWEWQWRMYKQKKDGQDEFHNTTDPVARSVPVASRPHANGNHSNGAYKNGYLNRNIDGLNEEAVIKKAKMA